MDHALPVLEAKPAAALAGILSHLLYFKRGERQLHPERYLVAFFLAFVASVLTLRHTADLPLRAAFQATATFASLYLAGLYSSLILYRLLFNPLNKFPGPFWARLSSLHIAFRVRKKKDFHMYMLRMHQKHGRIVRIGPNDLSIIDADCVQVVSSAQSKCTRSIFYDQHLPITSLHVTRDAREHAQRRRVWSRAFSDSALRGYESRVQKYNDLLLNHVRNSNGTPMDMTRWFNIYSFDVMGDLGFGQSFGMLETGEMHWAVATLQDALTILGFNFPTWVIRLLHALFSGNEAVREFQGFFISQLERRMQLQGKLDKLDISHFLVDHFFKSDPKTQKTLVPMLQGDTRLIIIAGSDTTAITLTHLFYYLTTVPGLQERVRQEINEYRQLDGSFSNRDLQSAALLLNACINETLRLHPAVASGVPRKTPKTGVHIRDIYIPADTVIQIPWFSMGRDPEYFPDPKKFIPERFTDRPDLITHKDAWGPFSVGPYNCIGKNLAYMEIRGLTARLLTEFDVSLAPGEDGQKLINESRDHFTLGLPPFSLSFEKRQ
ncbi:cytochrome P450 [Aspergillus floccosus]